MVRALAVTVGLTAIATILSGFTSQAIAGSAVEIIRSKPVPGFLPTEVSRHTLASGLGSAIATDYAIYCQPQDIPQDRPLCLGGVGGEVDTGVPVSDASPETNVELAKQLEPLAAIVLYQYDKVQLFSLP
ncbi:hypothetical protein OsccyDRAFT_3643 [Leptolyngbyaceae cyanobacterium JSC-12]|nr:hypothetical protein OsccyDRAFT_3643 [Leptolyngbyaceae cyanobacterium JSC-12]